MQMKDYIYTVTNDGKASIKEFSYKWIDNSTY